MGQAVEGEEREAWWRKQIERNRARTTPQEGNYWHSDSHRSFSAQYLLPIENRLAQAVWYMGRMDFIPGIPHPPSLCQKPYHGNVGSCPKMACRSTESTGDAQLQALAFLARDRNHPSNSLAYFYPSQAKPEQWKHSYVTRFQLQMKARRSTRLVVGVCYRY